MLDLTNYDFDNSVIPKQIGELLSQLTTPKGSFSQKINDNSEVVQFCKANNTKPEFLIYMLKHNILEWKYCAYCGKKIDPQRKYCGHECASADPKRREKAKQTCLEKYGVDNIFKSKQFKDYLKQYNLEHYGVEYTTQAEEIKQKKVATFRKKYGVDVPAKNPTIRQKMKDTFIERYGEESYKNHLKDAIKNKYGVDNISQTQQWKHQFKQTCLEKYGVDHPLKNDLIKQKVADTKIERYGEQWYRENINDATIRVHGDIASRLPWVREKVKQTSLQRYGSTSPMNSVENIDKHKRDHYTAVYDKFCKLIKLKGYTCLSSQQQFADYTQAIQLQHQCGKIVNTLERSFYKIRVCECQSQTSIGENELFQYIQSLVPNVEIIRHDRKVLGKQELDIYIPSLKLAFEFNGNYWHSSLFHNKTYHTNKTKQCNKKGIRLIHVFEYQWTNKRKQIENVIKNVLRLNTIIDLNTLNCHEISQDLFDQFVETNGLAATTPCQCFGLYDNDQLVYVYGMKNGVCVVHCGLIGYDYLNIKDVIKAPIVIDGSYESYRIDAQLYDTNWTFVKNGTNVIENHKVSKRQEQQMIEEGWLKLYHSASLLV